MSGRPTIDPASAPAPIAELLERAARLTDRAMADKLATVSGSATDPVDRLFAAMRHAALAPGKRLRPALVIAACEAMGGREADAIPAACAIELLHCYTLVHDDLPAMDDDDVRRGRPTVHRAFDEATAILAGDGLLTMAFACLAELPRGGIDAVEVLARRSGPHELLGGQALDLAAESAMPVDLDMVERIHRGKTGALFAASTELGGIAAGADRSAREALAELGMGLGVAFQFADDIDDGDFAELAAAARERRAAWAGRAMAAGERLGASAATLVDLARWVGGL